jgi:hypothetical protein
MSQSRAGEAPAHILCLAQDIRVAGAVKGQNPANMAATG